ncbi:MAG: SAM-dependent methyltransferase, partial [Rubrobacteraceae bacterium]
GLLRSPAPPSEIHATELQEAHLGIARKLQSGSSNSKVVVRHANIFDLDLHRDILWNASGPLLVVGNPPWVTSAELGTLGSDNLPGKTNLKKLGGMEAMTGSSNFVIAEYIWLKLIRELSAERVTIALLCKTSVARNVLRFAFDAALPITRASIRKIDAKKWFGASVEACLFCVEAGPGERYYEAEVYPSLSATVPESTMGFANGRLVRDIEGYRRFSFADGACQMVWRQGLKHDAASVMELSRDESGGLRNKLGEIVDVESEYVYPLLKGSDLFHQRLPGKFVIVTQRKLGESTKSLEWAAPRLWNYLAAHADVFERRKSSIYRNKPSFAMFGIGDYSFSPYKVGVSGLRKTPRFGVIRPVDGRTVMLDDTSYFVACRSPEQAALLAALLNEPASIALIGAMVFLDAKRPITKKLLQRIDLKALLDKADKQTLQNRAEACLARLDPPTSRQETSWPSPLEGLMFAGTAHDSGETQMSLEF